MKIEVNKSAKAERVQNAFDECVKWITANASQGIETTELIIAKDISGDVYDRLKKEVEGIHFCIVDSRINQYTGRMDHFASRAVGDNRYYKVKLNK